MKALEEQLAEFLQQAENKRTLEGFLRKLIDLELCCDALTFLNLQNAMLTDLLKDQDTLDGFKSEIVWNTINIATHVMGVSDSYNRVMAQFRRKSCEKMSLEKLKSIKT